MRALWLSPASGGVGASWCVSGVLAGYCDGAGVSRGWERDGRGKFRHLGMRRVRSVDGAERLDYLYEMVCRECAGSFTGGAPERISEALCGRCAGLVLTLEVGL